MKGENLRDYLKPKQAPVEPLQLPEHCELRGCPCRSYGKPEIAIHVPKDATRYVCERGYQWHLDRHNLDRFSAFKETGAPLGDRQQSFESLDKARAFAEVVHDIDALADRYAEQQEESE